MLLKSLKHYIGVIKAGVITQLAKHDLDGRLIILLVTGGPVSSIITLYMFCTCGGINALYFRSFCIFLFLELSPDQVATGLELPSTQELLQQLAGDRENAIILYNQCLSGWFKKSHQMMLDHTYRQAMLTRIQICFTFLTFPTFSDWLNLLFIKFQPIMPWGTLYNVCTGLEYGADLLDYRSFIRRGAKLVYKLVEDEPLSADEYDPLAEFLIFIAYELSASAQGSKLTNMLVNSELPVVEPFDIPDDD